MPVVGDVLAGRYRIEAPIGAGGMASVYRAHDLRLERTVALKVLLPNLAADLVLAERFAREALALAATANPSVVKVFDVEPGDPATGREPFYVMEWCDGGSLADRLGTSGRLDPGELVAVVAAVADGLADLHRRGFIHRDVKPHNILFDQGRARLADFGLARPEENSELSVLTASGTVVGTLAYLAPELLAGEPATPASDVYALGVVAFQGLTGRLPRPAASMAELVALHAEPVATVCSIAPGVSVAFDAAVAAALARDPDARPTPLDLARQLTDADAAHLPETTFEIPAVAALGGIAEPPFIDPSAVTETDLRPVTRAHAVHPIDAEPNPARPAIVGALILVALLVLALAALWLSGVGGGGSVPGPTSPAPATPFPSSTPSATTTPATITPPGDPAAEAYAVLDRIDGAIEDLAGVDGIRDRDLDALRRRAGEVRNALAAGDYDKALADVARLDDEVDRVDDRAQGEAMDRLKNAVSDLDEAIPSR